MENKQETQQQLTLKSYFARDEVKQKFTEMLGKKAAGFITSVLQVAASSERLAKADPISVYNSAAMAATLDLPINANLGFAYIIPYELSVPLGNGKWEKKSVAQFQMGYKGFIQLAQRSGQFKTLNATDVREGELKVRDRLTGAIEFEWIKDEATREKAPIIGYVSYFQLVSGFEKLFYMSTQKINAHAQKYSKSFSKANGLWQTDFESMALKTVTKMLLSKFAPLSIEMQKAISVDQAVLNDENGESLTYPDNNTEDIPHEDVNKERDRARQMIQDAETIKELMSLVPQVMEYKLDEEYQKRMEELKEKN